MVHNRLKTMLMVTVVAGGTMISQHTWASPNTSQIVQLSVSGVSSVISAALTYCTGAVLMPGMNTDPAQLIAEGLVTYWTIVLDKEWEEEPQAQYKYSAYANSSGEGEADIEAEDLSAAIELRPAVLTSLGIEALGLGPDASIYADAGTRSTIATGLSYLKADDSDSNKFVFDYDLTIQDEQIRKTNQTNHLQFSSTAGVTRAELGMKAVIQSAINEGSSIDPDQLSAAQAGEGQPAGVAAEVEAAQVTQDYLRDIPGKALTTVHAMRIMDLMNLEHAQRINLGNMLQGEMLAVEAARALATTKSQSEQED